MVYQRNSPTQRVNKEHRNVMKMYQFFSFPYLSKIQVNEAEREELQTDREAVEQPVDRNR